ncbi:MAG: Spy/CpxP family protein refolding chaperone [Gallionella sp.]
MKKIANKFRHGLMIGAIALVLPLAASSAPCDWQDEHASSKSLEAIAMHNDMMLLMQQGVSPSPPGAMMAPPPFPPDGKLIPPFLRNLDLTESQQDKIFVLLHNQEPSMRERHKAVRKAAEELNRLAASDHYKPSELQTLADKLAKKLADTFVQHATTEIKILALLTAEQRKQADEMRSRFGAIHGHDKNHLR